MCGGNGCLIPCSVLHPPFPPRQVATADTALTAQSAEMADVRGRWLPELTRIIETINDSFGLNFAEIG